MTQAVPNEYLSRDDFRRWAEGRPGRYERVEGRVSAMAAGRLAQIRMKTRVWSSLRRAISAAGASCEAFGDGVTVETGDSDYEPEALVDCGPPGTDEAFSVPNPVIVVEVLSLSTAAVSSGQKLAGYFGVPSIQHYLIIHPTRRTVIHHRRDGDRIETMIVVAGPITLDPPGLLITLEDLYEAEAS